MDLLSHESDLTLARMRLTANRSSIVLAAVGVGYVCSWIAWTCDGLRSSTGMTRFVRALVVLAIATVFHVLLAGLLCGDSSRTLGTRTPQGRLALAVLAGVTIALAALLVAGIARIRRRPPHGWSRALLWVPVPLIAAFVVLASLPAKERPNLILIVVDTLRADHVVGSDPKAHTPNIEALSAEGVSFERAFSHATLTLPSHTTLFSSRYPHLTGVVNNGTSVQHDLPLLSEWLQAFGYETRAVVSLGTLHNRLERGFARYDDDVQPMRQAPTTVRHLDAQLEDLSDGRPFFLFAHFADPHAPYNNHDTPGADASILIDGEFVSRVTTGNASMWEAEVTLGPGAHRLEVVSDEDFKIRRFSAGGNEAVVRWAFEGDGDMRTRLSEATIVLHNDLKESVAVSFAMWIQDVPTREESIDRYRQEVEFIDEHLGQLVARLRALDLWEESLVIFTSDHGESLGEHGAFGSHGHNVYEELIHVPLIVKLPTGHPMEKEIRANRISIARHIDVVPTVLEILGLPPLPGQIGVSLLEPGPRLVVSESHPPYAEHSTYALRDDEYKLVYIADEESFELYHLSTDPGELENVADIDPHPRSSWPEMLRTIARTSHFEASVEDPERQELLRALGYAGE